jgi:hypothetical protein
MPHARAPPLPPAGPGRGRGHGEAGGVRAVPRRTDGVGAGQDGTGRNGKGFLLPF